MTFLEKLRSNAALYGMAARQTPIVHLIEAADREIAQLRQENAQLRDELAKTKAPGN